MPLRLLYTIIIVMDHFENLGEKLHNFLSFPNPISNQSHRRPQVSPSHHHYYPHPIGDLIHTTDDFM